MDEPRKLSAKAIRQRKRRQQQAIERRSGHQQKRVPLKQAHTPPEVPKPKDNTSHPEAVEQSRLSCVQLCSAIHATLPRNVRDRIYDEIISPYHYEHVTARGDLTKNGVIGQKGLTFQNPALRSRQYIYWWAEKYMSPAVAKEVVEDWYCTRHFVFGAKSMHMLPLFLREDVFGTGVDPGSLVQHLRYHIDGEVTKLDSMGKWGGITTRHLVQEASRHVDLAICIESHAKTDRAVQLAVDIGVLKNVGPVVFGLRREGFDFVTVRRRNPWKDVTFLFEVGEDAFQEGLRWWERMQLEAIKGEQLASV